MWKDNTSYLECIQTSSDIDQTSVKQVAVLAATEASVAPDICAHVDSCGVFVTRRRGSVVQGHTGGLGETLLKSRLIIWGQ